MCQWCPCMEVQRRLSVKLQRWILFLLETLRCWRCMSCGNTCPESCRQDIETTQETEACAVNSTSTSDVGKHFGLRPDMFQSCFGPVVPHYDPFWNRNYITCHYILEAYYYYFYFTGIAVRRLS